MQAACSEELQCLRPLVWVVAGHSKTCLLLCRLVRLACIATALLDDTGWNVKAHAACACAGTAMCTLNTGSIL